MLNQLTCRCFFALSIQSGTVNTSIKSKLIEFAFKFLQENLVKREFDALYIYIVVKSLLGLNSNYQGCVKLCICIKRRYIRGANKIETSSKICISPVCTGVKLFQPRDEREANP